jgi:lysophospholipase L1-like esterase
LQNTIDYGNRLRHNNTIHSVGHDFYIDSLGNYSTFSGKTATFDNQTGAYTEIHQDSANAYLYSQSYTGLNISEVRTHQDSAHFQSYDSLGHNARFTAFGKGTLNSYASIADSLNSPKIVFGDANYKNTDSTKVLATNSVGDMVFKTLYSSNPALPCYGVLQPGYVTGSGSGLTVNVTAAVYRINCVTYNSAAGSVTLSTADATNPSYDVVYVDNTGSIGVITGTASANPSIPQVDPATQIELTSIFVDAGATSLPITDQVIYDENTEAWTGTATGVTANFTNTLNVQHGTKSADVGSWTTGQQLNFTKNSGTITATDYGILTFYVKLKATLASTANIRVSFLNGTTVVSSVVTLAAAQGFTKTSTAYQTIAIPLSAFTFTSTTVNKVRITLVGTGGGMYLDYLRLQSGVTQSPTETDAIALAKTITENDGYGLIETQTATQALSTNPSWTRRIDTFAISTRAWRQKLADSLGSVISNSATLEQPIGQIYNQASFSNTTNLLDSGSVSPTFSGGEMILTNGSSTYSKTISMNTGNYAYTALPQWKIALKIKPTGTSTGAFVGIRSINTWSTFNIDCYGKIILDGTASNGTLIIVSGSSHLTAATSASKLTFSTNDLIVLTLERDWNNIVFTARNATTNSAIVSVSYAFDMSTAAGLIMPNTGRFSFGSLSASPALNIDSFAINSYAQKNAQMMVVGDSKSSGYCASSFATSWDYQLAQYFRSFVYEAQDADKTSEVLARINEIVDMKPQNILLNIGRNDIQTLTGLDSNATKTNYAAIVSAFQAAGITVWHLLPFYETVSDQTWLVNYINRTFPADHIIDTWTATRFAGLINSDNVHPNDLGHSVVYKTVLNSFNYKTVIPYQHYSSGGNILASANYTPQYTPSGGFTYTPLVSPYVTGTNVGFGTTTPHNFGPSLNSVEIDGSSFGVLTLGRQGQTKWRYMSSDGTGLVQFGYDNNGTDVVHHQMTVNGTFIVGSASDLNQGMLQLPAGTTTRSPLQLVTGTSTTTARAGQLEYTTPQVFFTNGDLIRQEIPQIQQSRVSTQFDKTSSTALANITGLTASLAAGKTYRFEAILYTTSNVAGGVQFAIAGTSTATSIIYEDLVNDANTNAAQTRATALATAVGGVTAVTNAYSKITGTITVNAAGTLTVQFAQNASNGTASSVLVGSTFVVTQIN